jgi:sulfate permease, SulP family
MPPRPPASSPFAVALRRSLAAGYGLATLRADLFAGLVVGVVALPLSMALAIAVGVAPQHGLYTAIFAGALCAALGGSKFQVTGPTAAFVVVLAPITTRFGLKGLLTAGFMAGVILVGLGAAKLGKLIQYVPYPVVTGFTTGIAVVIGTLQIKDALGLQTIAAPEHYVEKIGALWSARATVEPAALATSALTLALLVGLPRVVKRVPAPLLALTAVTLLTTALHAWWPAFTVETIGSRFHTTIGGVDYNGIPPVLPSPTPPWEGVLPDFALVRELLQPAIAIALLGAIESLLSAVIADGMTGKKHDPNAELIALGIGNLVAPIFGGIAATGALARTATNVRSGARSPIAAIVHAIVVLLAMLALAPLVAYLPMASLAALLMLVSWNMSEVRQFVGILRVAPKSDVAILITCLLLTVFFDMVVAVTVGFLAAAVLFMRRMAELTQTRLQLDSISEDAQHELPPGVILYEINGPLFFGAAQTAMGTLDRIGTGDFRVLVMNLGQVPAIDATGFVALENAIKRVADSGRQVVIAGPLPKPRSIFDKAQLERKYPGLKLAPTLAAALHLAAEAAGSDGPPRVEPSGPAAMAGGLLPHP